MSSGFVIFCGITIIRKYAHFSHNLSIIVYYLSCPYMSDCVSISTHIIQSNGQIKHFINVCMYTKPVISPCFGLPMTVNDAMIYVIAPQNK